MNQYIITDKEHNRLWVLLPKFGLEERKGQYAQVSIDSIIEINKILQNIGSHPYQSERDKVLDELETFIGNIQFKYGLLSNSYLNNIKDKIEELRQQAGEPLCH
jgi:hypothetical protein